MTSQERSGGKYDGALILTKGDKKICPLTRKPITEARCYGQHDMRLLKFDLPCDQEKTQLRCIPMVDDIDHKVQR